jgi:hypothetical protein
MAIDTRKTPKCNFKKITLKTAKRKFQIKKSFEIVDIIYKSPVNKDLAIGLVYFNAAKSKRLLMNYLYVTEKFKISNIPYFTIEMYETTPEIADAIHLKTDFILFQKERLCYLLEKHIPKSFTKILFIDSDLIFENSNWYNELSDKLNNFNIVQPFSKAVWLDITYKKVVKERIPIIFYNKFGVISMDGGIGGYHPGFAWAFQRNWYNKVGFFQNAILGDGDTISSTIWLNFNFEYRAFLKNAVEDFKKSMGEKPSICFLNGAIFHLWHGDSRNRQYRSRRDIFESVNDIRNIIYVADNGLYCLKDDKLKNKIRKYFKNRDDDGLSLDNNTN